MFWWKCDRCGEQISVYDLVKSLGMIIVVRTSYPIAWRGGLLLQIAKLTKAILCRTRWMCTLTQAGTLKTLNRLYHDSFLLANSSMSEQHFLGNVCFIPIFCLFLCEVIQQDWGKTFHKWELQWWEHEGKANPRTYRFSSMSLTHCSGGLHQKAMKSSLISSSSWMLGRLLKNLFFISIYSVCVKIILSLLSVPVRLLLQVLRESFKYEQTTSERVPLVFMQKVHFFLSFHEQYPFATAVVPMHQFFLPFVGQAGPENSPYSHFGHCHVQCSS